MDFKIISPIRDVEVIAQGHRIKNLKRLNKTYGTANWRKLKGSCTVELESGLVLKAEVHWYEAHGVGKKEFKLKRYL
jgi:hypothetical protein